MGKLTVNSKCDQAVRLRMKNIDQQMKNAAVKGTGLSLWEAEVLVDMIKEIYLENPHNKSLHDGQIQYRCISASEGPGKKLEDCEIKCVILTLFDENDEKNLSYESNKANSIETRRRRIVRLCEEAKDQEAYLTQEDLSKLLMSDVRTIRRDIKVLKELGIILPTRGQQKDIGPGITHRALTIQKWLEGHEPVAIAQQIKHSIAAVENYLQKFKRVSYLKMKGFDQFEIALTVGISNSAARTFIDLYEGFKNKSFFEDRLNEINILGKKYYQSEDEKKSIQLSKESTKSAWRKQ